MGRLQKEQSLWDQVVQPNVQHFSRKWRVGLALSALALNCTLKRGDQKSSTQKLLDEILHALAKHDVVGEALRVVDLTGNSDRGEPFRRSPRRLPLSDITPYLLGLGTA
jgi:hypothetical protein